MTTDYYRNLIEKLDNREAKIGIVGMGYVGFPLAVAFARAGFQVTGIELSQDKVNQLNQGESYIIDIPSEHLKPVVQNGKLRATTDYSVLKDIDCISICVPTPLNENHDPDMSYVQQAITAILPFMHPGMLISLESTVYPGATRETIALPLAEADLTIGEDLFVAFSPERISPGDPGFNVHNIPKLVGGITEQCGNLCKHYYEIVINPITRVSSTIVAELSKLLENTFRAVNIGLVNELAIMCNYLDVNVWEVIDAAATKPFGFMAHYPGPGIGGHCIPLDPHYLSWKMRQFNYHARFIEVASEINSSMPHYIVEKVTEALNDKAMAVKNSRIAILGIAYKPDIDDVRESPALEIIEQLQHRGAVVEWHDPHAHRVYLGEELTHSAELTQEWLENQDCVIIVTHHRAYDWQFVLNHTSLVIDSRNVTAGLTGKARIIPLAGQV